jgi:hypothetical protein
MEVISPGEFIHMIFLELPTAEGSSILFVSVDNFSRYCFSNNLARRLTFESLTEHIDSIISELRVLKSTISIPTLIMGYGKPMQVKLELYYKGKAHFWFNEELALEIARPVADELIKYMLRKSKSN